MQRRGVPLSSRRGRRSWCAAAAVLSASFAVGGRDARADSCTTPDLLETIPPDGARDVPTNATLFARYASVAQYLGEPVQLEHVGVDTQPVAATFDAAEAMLSVAPPAPLVAGDSYVIHWPGLRGLDTANLGTGLDQHLRAAASPDVDPPTFDGITGLAWDVTRERDACSGSIDERYAFDLSLGEAADDGGRDSLTLLVFRTAGPRLAPGAREQVLLQRIPAAGQTVRVSSAVDHAVGHVCFAAIARDLTGKVSSGGVEKCVDTASPPFFYGCATALPGSAGDGQWLAAAVLALVIALSRRGRRRAPLGVSG